MQAYEDILAIGRAHPTLDVATALNWAANVESEAEVADPQREVEDQDEGNFDDVFSAEFSLSDDFQPLESMT
jgi:hypothetical protein